MKNSASAPIFFNEVAVEALAELGCYGMTRTMDFIATGWIFAKEGRVPTLSEVDLKKAATAMRACLAKRQLSDDFIYTRFLRNQKDVSKPLAELPVNG